MTLLNNKKHRTTVSRVLACITLVMVVLCLPFNVAAADVVDPSKPIDKVAILGQGSYDNYRGYEVLSGLRPTNADLYYASGQDRVRHAVSYPFFNFNEGNSIVWTNQLVKMGYGFDFYSYDAQENGFSLPLVTGLRWSFDSHLTEIIYHNEDATFFQAKIINCSIKVRYRLYDSSGMDSDVFPEKTVVKNLTETEIIKSMTQSNLFEQNWQVPTFSYTLDFDFTRPVLLQGCEVNLTVQLYSDFSRDGHIEYFAPVLWNDLQESQRLGVGSLYQATKNLGVITDYSFPVLKGFYNDFASMREEFITLGLSGDFTQWVLDSYTPIDEVEALSLSESVDFSGGSLSVIGQIFIRLIGIDFISAIVGAALTFAIISAFVGVAVYFGRRNRKG